MKTLSRICAALLALLMVCSVSLSVCAEETNRAALGKEMKAAASNPTPSPTPTPKKKSNAVITLSGSESYTMEEMRDALGGKPVLLRNSCIDAKIDGDLSLLYEAMDFAVLNNQRSVILPLTKEQYNAAYNGLERNGFLREMYPELSWFEIREHPSGRYRISFSFMKYGGGSDEECMKKLVQARSAAIDIVNKIPYTIRSSDNRLRYLYKYVTKNIKASKNESTYWVNGRGNSLLYESLIERDTVCAGFSYAFAYLCELAGIDAQWVVLNNENRALEKTHAAVIATVYNTSRWYDPTWDRGREERDYEYFGMTDKELAANHGAYYGTLYDRDLYPECG